jgi:hypothetical protein
MARAAGTSADVPACGGRRERLGSALASLVTALTAVFASLSWSGLRLVRCPTTRAITCWCRRPGCSRRPMPRSRPYRARGSSLRGVEQCLGALALPSIVTRVQHRGVVVLGVGAPGGERPSRCWRRARPRNGAPPPPSFPSPSQDSEIALTGCRCFARAGERGEDGDTGEDRADAGGGPRRRSRHV